MRRWGPTGVEAAESVQMLSALLWGASLLNRLQILQLAGGGVEICIMLLCNGLSYKYDVIERKEYYLTSGRQSILK